MSLRCALGPGLSTGIVLLLRRPPASRACTPSPKGLQHGLGVNAVGQGVPLNLVQRWLGHAQLSTTAIYAEAVGEEERSIAARMWR